jgi:hypothetical protein
MSRRFMRPPPAARRRRPPPRSATRAQETQAVGAGDLAFPLQLVGVDRAEVPQAQGLDQRRLGRAADHAGAAAGGQRGLAGHRLVEHHLAQVQLDHPVDQRRHLVDAVAADQHGAALGSFGQQFEEDAARLRVEVGRRLVHHQHARVAAERDGDQQLLLHAARQAVEGSREDRTDLQPQPCGDLVHTRAGRAAQGGGEVDQLADRHLQGRRQLRHEAHQAEHARALAPRVQAGDPHLAFVRVLAQQAADQRGLAGTVAADQGHAFALGQRQVEIVEHAHAAEALAQALELDHGGSSFTAAGTGP